METLIEFLKTDTVLLITLGVITILLVGFLILLIKFFMLNNKYKNFMKKVGNGKNIQEDLENYMKVIEDVKNQNIQINANIKSIETNISKCIQKVGIVRYSAFKDTGSDLSFALALLDENNDGVVLNGIYSREMSNIYAKPIKQGNSSYTISEEEKNAIEKAVEVNKIYKID